MLRCAPALALVLLLQSVPAHADEWVIGDEDASVLDEDDTLDPAGPPKPDEPKKPKGPDVPTPGGCDCNTPGGGAPTSLGLGALCVLALLAGRTRR